MPMAPKLDRMESYHEGVLPVKSYGPLVTWSRARSRDKLKTLYLHYQSAYSQQIWQDVNLL